MAGIYIHIPFCRKLCIYCDFHRSNIFENKNKLVSTLINEIELRDGYLEYQNIETIYFGGGTPSVLTMHEINNILNKIYSIYNIVPDVEITFEANPDDLTNQYLSDLKNSTPINRLSIGIQSFIDRDLKFLNRRHDSVRAIESVENALKVGFSNLSIDLIYAIPGMTLKEWNINLNQAFSLNIQHLSAYHLTYEPKTELSKMLDKKEITSATEDDSIDQYKLLIEQAEQHNFEHYEISNFSKNRLYSRHNTNYWNGNMYLGIGPSAHSYNIFTRQWNVSDNDAYIKCIEKNEKFYEIETLDIKAKFNEYIMTGLRTMWGIDLNYIRNTFGNKFYNRFKQNSMKFVETGKMLNHSENYILSKEGKLIADYIITELFID